MSIQKFELFLENLKNGNGKKIDYYHLDDFNLGLIRQLYNSFKTNSYRAIATFAEQLEMFEEFPATKIALINYPIERTTHHKFQNDIESVLKQGIADEIEFPWQSQHLSWSKDKWRNIVLRCTSKGVILRPMLEICVDSVAHLSESIQLFKEIGITNIMTSTGLIQEITTQEKYDEVKDIFPPIFKIKVAAGIVDLTTASEFFKKGAHLIATTSDLLNINQVR